MRWFVWLVAVGWVSAVAWAACPSCINTDNSACSRWGSGRAFFKWASDQEAGSNITLTAAGSCGSGSGESGKAYIIYVNDAHSAECNGETPCDDGFSSNGAVAVIKVSGSKKGFKNTMGSLTFTSDKTYTYNGKEYFYSMGVSEAGCAYVLPMAGAGGGRIKLSAGVGSGSGSGKFNISVKFYEILSKYGYPDRYTLLAAAQGSINVVINKSSDSDPVNFRPDLRDGSSIAGYQTIDRYYSSDYGDTDWMLQYREKGESDCDQGQFWAGKYECEDDILIPSWESFEKVKYPGWGRGVNGNPPYTDQGGWSTTPPNSGYAMLAMNGSDWLWRYLLMSSGYIQNTVYMMHYDMGDLGIMYYRGEYYSQDRLRVRQIEYCPKDVHFGQGQILWTFCYDDLNRIQYIHNTNYDDPNNQPDPNSINNATAYYYYQYEGTNNDPTVTYYTRPDTQSSWTLQRNWELEFDSEGRATKFQGGCSSGCGGTGTFEHIEYYQDYDDLITDQYNAAEIKILENEYEEIEYGQYEPAGEIRIPNGGFELPDVATNNCQMLSELNGWDLTNGPVTICDPNNGSGCQYLEFSDTAQQTLTQEISSVSPNSFYTLQADIRAHNIPYGKHGVIELWIVKDGQIPEKIAYIDANDVNLQGTDWITMTADWNNKGDERFSGILLQDLWFFEVVVKGLKVDMDNITLSKSIWVGNTTKPIIKEQKKANSQGTLVTTLKRSFDKPNKQIIERAYVAADSCRVIKYEYEDETFTNLVKKTEWENLGTSSGFPTGASYETTYSNDANNITYLPGGKYANVQRYDTTGQIIETYRLNLANDSNTLREQFTYEYYDPQGNDNYTDIQLKQSINPVGGITDYEYETGSRLLKKKTDPQTAAGRLVTEYVYDDARRLIEERRTKQDQPSIILHRTVNHYNPVTGFLDWTQEIGGSDYAATYYQYNSLGQIIRQINPDGVKTGNSYGSGGQLISEFILAEGCDPNQTDDDLDLISQTRYTYTADGLIEKIGKYKSDGIFDYQSSIPDPADPNEWVVTKYEYYPDGKQKKVIEDYGTGTANLTTEYFYNLQGEIEKVAYPTGKWIKTTRNGRGLVILEEVGYDTNTVVLETSYDYDADGNLKEQHNPDGTSQFYQYNNFNQLWKVFQQDPNNGPRTEKFYDNAGNVIRELFADSDGTLLKDIRRRYDAIGNLEMERICAEPNVVDDTDDVVAWYKYDVLGNLKYTVGDGPGCSDPNSITDPNNIVTEYMYDGLGRKQHTIDPAGILSSVYYSPAGQPVKIVDPNDPDDPNRFVTENFYDAAGRLIKTIDSQGHYTLNSYDSLNRLTKQIVYDCNTTVDNMADDFAVRQTRAEYDNLGNVIRQVIMKDPNSEGQAVVGVDLITDYVYDYTMGLLYQTKTYYGDNATPAVTTYDYDDIGRKISTVDPEGNEDHIEYCEDTPALVEKTQRLENNPGGNDYTITTFFEYDNYGRLWKRILDKDGDGNKEETDTITEYLYDGLGRLTNEIAPDGIVTFTEYDAFGNVRQKIEDYDPQSEEAFNKTTEYVYNRLNQLYRIMAYDPNLTNPLDVSIQTTTYEYDNAGLVTKIIYPDLKYVAYIYNIQNKLDTEIQRNGRWIAYWYDQNRNLIQVSDYDPNDPNWPTDGPAEFVETFTYDAAGNLKTAQKNEGENPVSHSEFTYNGFGLKTSETAAYFDMEPVTTTWDYDGSGNLISQTHAETTLSYTHDGLGRIKTIDRNGDRIVNYSYIGSGTKAIEYPEPQITQSYSYDELGRVNGVGSIDGDENTILDFVYDYDLVGNRQSEKYNHLTTPVWDKFYYDNLRRLNQVDYAADSPFASAVEQPDSGTTRLSYIASLVLQWLDDGTILASVDRAASHFVIPNLLAAEESVDSVSSSVIPAQAGIPSLPSVQSAKSVVSNLLTLAEFSTSSDADSKVRTETIYDDNGRLSAQIIYDANGNIILFAIYLDDGGKVVITSAYDTNGNLTSQVFTTYDAAGNVISRENMPIPTETSEATVALEAVFPNPLAGEESVYSATSSFSQADLWLMEAELFYDGGMMLMSAPSGPSSRSQAFTYDHLGNRYQVEDDYGFLVSTDTYVHNSINQYQTKTTYDSWTGTSQYSMQHDDNGNLEMDQNGSIYTYDYRNRLVSIGDGVTATAEYVYDALGRRISKTTDGTTTYFYYDTDNRVIAQYVQEQSQNVQPDCTFVYGNGITEVLAMFLYEKPYSQDDVDLLFGFFDCWLTSSGGNGYNDSYDYVDDGKIDLKDWAVLANRSWNLPDPASYETRYYYLTDALGSVRGLIGGRLNQESDREFYNYDVYGATIDSSAAGNPFRFAGYRYDSETGYYHLWTRTYDPATGRLLQMDEDYYDSMNLYEYVLSNPTNYVDPWGLWSKNGMMQEFNSRYGTEGQMLLGLMGYEGFSIEPRNYWSNDWDYEEENGVLGISSWGMGFDGWGIDDSDASAARQLYDALKSRYGKALGKILKNCLKKLCGAGQIAGQQDWADDPAFQSFMETYGQQQLEAALMGSAVQNYTEEEAKAFIASIVGGKCLDKALDALQDARQARRAAKAARLPAKGTAERKAIEAARRRGIDAKKAQELANIRAGGKGSGVWSDAELGGIRQSGRFPGDVRWHHDPTVANRPDLADNPNVVTPVRGGVRGHLGAHGGDFRK